MKFVLLLISLVFLSACSPQSSEGPVTTTAAESPDTAAHSPATEHGSGPVHWSYGEDDGPASWAALSSDYVTCASGREQSPIDIAAIMTGNKGIKDRGKELSENQVERIKRIASYYEGIDLSPLGL